MKDLLLVALAITGLAGGAQAKPPPATAPAPAEPVVDVEELSITAQATCLPRVCASR